jgi:predicted SAM-dependent methyltransferase
MPPPKLVAGKVHVGCGPVALPGWLNVDNQPYPAVDQLLDVTKEWPFEDVKYIFAEHFIEHLSYQQAVAFLRECRRALRDDGILRLSTPNLDWVWLTHYAFPAGDGVSAIDACFNLNRAFHGWGHQFLYNEQTLAATLHEAGFSTAITQNYGESRDPELHGLEHHDRSPDLGSVSHILIMEASGRGGVFPEEAARMRGEFLRDVVVR